MLNTIMALWNQNPAESRHKTFKVILMSAFVSISMVLLLFTFNGSMWSLFAGGEHSSTKRDMSKHNTMTVGRDVGIIGITPTPTPIPTPTATIPTTIRVLPCAPTPTVIVSQKVFIAPHREATYVGNESLGKNKQKYVHPKSVSSKKGKPRSKKTVDVKATATPISQPTETIPALPVETTTVQRATPTVIATDVPTGSTIGGMQSARVLSMTEAASATPTASFKVHMQDKGVIRVFTSQQSRAVSENLLCGVPISGNK